MGAARARADRGVVLSFLPPMMVQLLVMMAVIISGSCFEAAAGAPAANGVKYGNKFFCFRGYKKCPGKIDQCIQPERECDGVKDCADGSDEGTRCATFDCAAAGRYRCPSGGNFCMNVSDSYGGSSWRYGYKDPYKYYLCDGVRDCFDGSDEDPKFCSQYKCGANVTHTPVAMTMDWSEPLSPRISCPGGGGRCLFESQLCDAVPHCPAGSDESDRLCKASGCERSGGSGNYFQCSSGRCLPKEVMCDGKRDCPDGDDEDGAWCARVECPNSWGRTKCPGGNNQTCIHNGKLCDGVRDCPGGTDEVGCNSTYECYYSKCPSGLCNHQYMTPCNGITECRDGSDEDPAYCQNYTCPEGYRKCKDGRQCIYRSDMCDGVQQCRDASDEDPAICETGNCTEAYYVKCPGRIKTCVSTWSVCDGSKDCLDGSDEDKKFCASKEADKILERSDRIRCKNNRTNIIYGTYCDGYTDCTDGSDEEKSFCKRHTCAADRVKCYGTWCVYGKRCDDNRDCPDGSDEAGCGGRSSTIRAAAPPTTGCKVGPGHGITECNP